MDGVGKLANIVICSRLKGFPLLRYQSLLLKALKCSVSIMASIGHCHCPDDSSILLHCSICRYSITVSATAFQAEDEGSIPFTCSVAENPSTRLGGTEHTYLFEKDNKWILIIIENHSDHRSIVQLGQNASLTRKRSLVRSQLDLQNLYMMG